MMESIELLDTCLDEISAGSTVAECLTRHPVNGELALMLEAATFAHHLSSQGLSESQRLRAKITLREAIAARSDRNRSRWTFPIVRARSLGFASVLAAFLLISASLTAVAFSKPGDLAYRIRIAVERVPLMWQTTDQGKTSSELALSDRRLADLQGSVSEDGSADDAALEALVSGDVSAAQQATTLPETERLTTATRMEEHAAELLRLASAGIDQEARVALQTAAEQVLAAAIRLRAGFPPEQSMPGGLPTAPVRYRLTATPSIEATKGTVTARSTASVTPAHTPERARTRAAIQSTPTPQNTATIITPGWRATQRSTTSTVAPTPSRTAVLPTGRPSGTPEAKPKATSSMATATARLATATARHATATARAGTRSPSTVAPAHTPVGRITPAVTETRQPPTGSPMPPDWPPTVRPATATPGPVETRAPTANPHTPQASATSKGPELTSDPRPTEQAPTATSKPSYESTPMPTAQGATRTPEGRGAPPTKPPEATPEATAAPTKQPGPGPAPSKTPGHS